MDWLVVVAICAVLLIIAIHFLRTEWGGVRGERRGPGVVMIDEDFEGSIQAWTTHGQAMEVIGGKFTFGTSGEWSGENRAFIGEASWVDYTFEVDATLIGGRGGYGYGIFFRADGGDALNGYSFQYDPGWGSGGSFLMRKWVNGSELTPFVHVPAPDGFQWVGVARHIAVDIAGKTFIVSIDGKKVLEATDDTYAQGLVGLRTWGTSAATFDNVRVTVR